MATIKALTVKQPWAWAIAHHEKRVENRTWKPKDPPDFLAIHAGKKDRDYVRSALNHLEGQKGIPIKDLPHPDLIPYGAVVAVSKIARIVEDRAELPAGQDRWWDGPVGWVLEDVTPIDPVECRGALGLWDLPPDVLAQVRKNYAAALEK